MDHSHHNHHPNNERNAKGTEAAEKIAEKTLHAHNRAIPNEGQHPSGHGEHGHDHHAMMIDDFRKRFWVSLLLSVPVIIISPMVQDILGYRLEIPFNMYIAFVLSSVIFFYGGWPFLTGFRMR